MCSPKVHYPCVPLGTCRLDQQITLCGYNETNKKTYKLQNVTCKKCLKYIKNKTFRYKGTINL